MLFNTFPYFWDRLIPSQSSDGPFFDRRLPAREAKRMRRRAVPAPPNTPIDEFEPVADALIDKLTLSYVLTFAGLPVEGIPELCRRLSGAGIISPGGGAPFRLAYTWRCPRSGADLPLGGALDLVAGSGGVIRAARRSKFEVGLLRLLRSQVVPVCELGLDGRENVVGPPEGDRASLLRIQLLTVSDLLDAFRGACASAAGCPVAMEVSVRAAEVNRDLPRDGAPDLARRLAREPSPWHRVSRVRHYRGAPATELDGNFVTVTWPNDNSSAPIRMKFYAKTAGLLRTEVCFDNPKAVELGSGWGDAPWPTAPATDGRGVAVRLEILARATLGRLDDMAAHVARLGAARLGVLDLMVALAPLMRSAAPPPPGRPGARPGSRTRGDVGYALYQLLTCGRFDASCVRSNSTVRKALDRIAGEGGLRAESRGRAPLFTVPAEFAEAREALSAAIWPRPRAGPTAGPRRLAGRGPVQ